MADYDIRQDKPYRRGLILGMTMAEIMILLIFVLLMALAAALSSREQQLKAIGEGSGTRLIEAMHAAYPDAKTPDDYYKELVLAIDARKSIEAVGIEKSRSSLVADAGLGRQVRDAALKQGAEDPYAFATKALTQTASGKRGEWPPFFSLSEAGGYYFDSGKATLRPDFERKLRTSIIPLLKRSIEEYGVDVVEVIGHTDEVPMAGKSNLDAMLIAASDSRAPIESLQSTDNAGLAMARAVAVVRVLRSRPELAGVTILPLSGAQMIVPVDQVADGSRSRDDQSRRRIEMRLRRSTEQVAPSGQN